MTLLLSGKIALITGSSRGIGAETAKLFARHGAIVIINYRKSKYDAEKVLGSIQRINKECIAIQSDVTRPSEVTKMFKTIVQKFGKLDILINNVSDYTAPHKITEVKWTDYQKEFDGAVKSTQLCCQQAISIMKKQQYGRIVNILTTLITRPASGYSAHITAKSALLGFTRTLAREVGEYGITVNMVSPGMTLTEENKKVSLAIRKNIAGKTPLKRLANPEDIANSILFFASDLSEFVTGSYLAVDGGLSMKEG